MGIEVEGCDLQDLNFSFTELECLQQRELIAVFQDSNIISVDLGTIIQQSHKSDTGRGMKSKIHEIHVC